MSKKTLIISVILGFIVGITPSFFGIYFYNISWWLIVIPIIIITAILREKYNLDNTLLTKINKFMKEYFYEKN